MQSWKRWKFCCPFFLVLTNPSTFQSQVQIQSNQNGRNKKKTYRCVAKYRLKLVHEHYTLQNPELSLILLYNRPLLSHSHILAFKARSVTSALWSLIVHILFSSLKNSNKTQWEARRRGTRQNRPARSTV